MAGEYINRPRISVGITLGITLVLLLVGILRIRRDIQIGKEREAANKGCRRSNEQGTDRQHDEIVPGNGLATVFQSELRDYTYEEQCDKENARYFNEKYPRLLEERFHKFVASHFPTILCSSDTHDGTAGAKHFGMKNPPSPSP
jgi:hypothetical protein